MRFARSIWRFQDRRVWTKKRLANARRAVQRDHDSVALFPELVKYRTVEDRVSEVDASDFELTLRMRTFQAMKWREARKLIQGLPPLTRKGMLRYWQQSPCPAEPVYLLETIREHLRTGFSPWSWIRFRHQMTMVGSGKLARCHLNETFNQHQYGQYPWMKLGSGKHKKFVRPPVAA